MYGKKISLSSNNSLDVFLPGVSTIDKQKLREHEKKKFFFLCFSEGGEEKKQIRFFFLRLIGIFIPLRSKNIDRK